MREEWNITAKKKLIEQNMSRRELAQKLNVNYSVLCGVLNGMIIRQTIKTKICDYLNIREVTR